MTYEESLTLISEKWSQLNQEQKLEVIQTIENHEAEINNRSACPVEGKFLYTGNDGVVLGQYDKETRSIYINDSQLSPDSKYGQTSTQMIQTVLHEGRHSYQHQSVEGKVEHPDKHEVEVWKENFDKYISFKEDPKGYFSQPIEVDARTYSAERYQQMISEREALISKMESESTKESVQIRNSILAQPNMETSSTTNRDSVQAGQLTSISTGNGMISEAGISPSSSYSQSQENDTESAKDVFVSQMSNEINSGVDIESAESVSVEVQDDSLGSDNGESDVEGISM